MLTIEANNLTFEYVRRLVELKNWIENEIPVCRRHLYLTVPDEWGRGREGPRRQRMMMMRGN